MKKIFISLMMAAAMLSAASCACSNNSDKAAQECSAEKCAKCDKKDSCGDKQECNTGCSDEECSKCDSTCVKDSANRR